MNKKILIGIAILLLVLGVYFINSKKPSTSTPQTASQSMSEAAEFARAIQSGKPTTCTLTKDGNIMEYHIKGKIMAANITTSVEGKTVLSHMINDEKYLYMWQEGQKQGSKMAIPTEEEVKSMSDQAKESQKNAPKLEGESDYQSFKDQGYTIKCQPSSTTPSFSPPSDVNFIDPSAMMKQGAGGAGSIDIKKLQEQYGGAQ